MRLLIKNPANILIKAPASLALSLCLLSSLTSAANAGEQPPGILLTWQQDPTTTMTIDWHTDPEHEGISTIRYKQVGTDAWQTVNAQTSKYAQSAHWSEDENASIGERTIHRVELTGLQPKTQYRFQVGEFTRKYYFETIQTSIDEEPLVFAAGGDNGTGSKFRAVNRAAMAYKPQFIAFGGDMAYEDGRADRVGRMHDWFTDVRDTLIHEDGRVVPIIVGIGNHEMLRTRGGNNYRNFPEFSNTRDFENYSGDIEKWRVDNAPYFFSLYAFPGQPGYDVLDFGDYMSLIMLDSDHANPVGGEQTRWLERVLKDRQHVTHLFPKYHEPGPYSSRRRNQNIGKVWIPRFEEHGVRVAFENHDHTFKRTHEIRGGEVVEEDAEERGVIYVGDGAWGIGARSVEHGDAWYMNRSSSTLHGWKVTLHGGKATFKAFNEKGEIFDEFEIEVEHTPSMPIRTWTDQQQGRAIEARFVRSIPGAVILQTEDGRNFEVDPNTLSEEDQQYIRDTTAEIID